MQNRERRHASLQQLEDVAPAPLSVDQHLDRKMEAWRRNSSWRDQRPYLKVTVPKGTLCHLETTFQLGLPPDAVFNIIIDPENKRVFRNIKEVTYRKVIEDEDHRQLVEVEQSAIWRFLCFSGTLAIRVFVDQNRHTHSVNYYLSKQGFMKKFDGQWTIKPVYVDAPHCAALPSPEDDPVCLSSRVASEVNLKQTVQPKLIPPPPVSWYVRGISAKQTEILIEYLQIEAKRLREGILKDEKSEQEMLESSKFSNLKPEVYGELNQGEQYAGSKRGRKKWRLRKPANPIEVSG